MPFRAPSFAILAALFLQISCGKDQRVADPVSGGSSGAGNSSGGDPGALEPVGEGEPDALWLDNFEDGDALGLVAGSSWSIYGDEGSGGASRVTTDWGEAGRLAPVGDGYQSTRSMRLDLSFDKKDYAFEPFIGLVLNFSQAQDLSQFEGLRYVYRGHRHNIRIQIPSVDDYDFHLMSLPAAAEWTEVTLWLDDFRQSGWGQSVERDFSTVDALSFEFKGETATGTGTFEVDDLRLLPSLPRPTEEDMAIMAPAPPEPVVLDDLSIDGSFAAFATAALDKGYNITNWLEQTRFSEFGVYDEAFVQRLADAGFESLRLPIDLDLYVDSREPLVVSDDLWTVLDAFDAWTAERSMSLTIDYHQYDGNFDPDNPASAALMVELWRAVSAHFAAEAREDLFFELLNEPELSASSHRGPTQAEWTAVASDMIDAIVAEDADRPIIFGDVRWYGIEELTNREPFDYDRIVYAFHFYEPFIFTHQGASWAGLGATHDIPYPYSEDRWSPYYRDFGFSEQANAAWQISALEWYHRDGNRTALYNRVAAAKQWAVTHQVPLVCNEFGVHEATSRAEDRVRYYDDLIDIFAELSISWQIWFMVMDATTGAVDAELADALDLSP